MRFRIVLPATMLLVLPLAGLLAAPTASASCASQAVVVDGQTVALLEYNAPSRGGPICITRLIVYDCTASVSTNLSVGFACSSTPVLDL